MKNQTKNKGIQSFYQINQQQDLLLYLIEKELHEAKIRTELENIGFVYEVLFINDLGDLILSMVGIEIREDDLWNWYQNLIEEYSNELDINNRETYKEPSLKVYYELKKGYKV